MVLGLFMMLIVILKQNFPLSYAMGNGFGDHLDQTILLRYKLDSLMLHWGLMTNQYGLSPRKVIMSALKPWTLLEKREIKLFGGK